jgi:hypothetical protein
MSGGLGGSGAALGPEGSRARVDRRSIGLGERHAIPVARRNQRPIEVPAGFAFWSLLLPDPAVERRVELILELAKLAQVPSELAEAPGGHWRERCRKTLGNFPIEAQHCFRHGYDGERQETALREIGEGAVDDAASVEEQMPGRRIRRWRRRIAPVSSADAIL